MRGQCGHLHWPYRLPPAVHMKRNYWPAVQHPSNPENQTKFDVLTVVPVEIKEFQDLTRRYCAHHMMKKYMLWNTCLKSLFGDVQSQQGSFFPNALEPCTYRNIYVSLLTWSVGTTFEFDNNNFDSIRSFDSYLKERFKWSNFKYIVFNIKTKYHIILIVNAASKLYYYQDFVSVT